MMRLRDAWPPAAIALGALALAALPAAAADHEPVKHKQIRIEKHVHDCGGDDCDAAKKHRRVIVIGDDGEVEEIGGDATRWIGHGGVHAFAMPFDGKGGFLGVATTELTRELRQHFQVPEDTGVMVAKVVEDSAAANAGVQVGDILTAVGGAAIDSTGDLIRAVRKLEPGSPVDLELYRDGTLQTLTATLGERQRPRRHAMFLHCGDDDEDCPQIASLHDFDCGEDSDCEVEIKCRHDDCECTVNGAATDCETLPGFAAPGE